MVFAFIAADDAASSSKWKKIYVNLFLLDGVSSGAFFAYTGLAIAIVFANMGAAYGTAKSGIGISNLG